MISLVEFRRRGIPFAERSDVSFADPAQAETWKAALLRADRTVVRAEVVPLPPGVEAPPPCLYPELVECRLEVDGCRGRREVLRLNGQSYLVRRHEAGVDLEKAGGGKDDGEVYEVRRESCSCPDALYRQAPKGEKCKHRTAALALGLV